MKNCNAITVALIVLISSACSAQAMKTVSLKVGPAVFQTEVAQTPQQRETGLMNRDSLAPDRAMLFVFEGEANRVFWMKNTRIPLSIAYISKSGVVKEIHSMEPQSLAPVSSRYSVTYALEVNRGAFEKFGVRVGDVVDLSVLLKD